MATPGEPYEPEHVHPRLSENAECRGVVVLADEISHLGERHPPLRGDRAAWELCVFAGEMSGSSRSLRASPSHRIRRASAPGSP